MNPLKPIIAVLQEIRDETGDTKTYTLLVNNDFTKAAVPGQFNMLGYPGIGEAPVSFSALGNNGVIQHTIRAVGMATRFLRKLTKGDEVLLRGPYGKGWPLEAAKGRDLLLIAGGIGLAPIRPVINQVLKHRADYGNVSVLYGSRNEKSLLFTHEYPDWRKAFSFHMTIDELVTTRQWNGNVGLVTGLLDNITLNIENTTAFVCGPEMMMRFICRGLLLRNVPAPDISVSLERRMKCGIAQCGHCQHAGLFVCKDGPVFSYRQVAGLMDGML